MDLKKLQPSFVCVTPCADTLLLSSCNPCSPDEISRGSQCYPCNPCSPDQLREGSQCYPCNPCSPDQVGGGSQCYPCNPCSPDQLNQGSQCYPCNPCSPDQLTGGSNTSGGCFISSACVNSLNLPDDCSQLQTLRRFRDERMQVDPAFASLVEEYYCIAPPMVQQIDAGEDAANIYSQLYDSLVQPCVQLIEQGNQDDAIALYLKIVRQLRRKLDAGHV